MVIEGLVVMASAKSLVHGVDMQGMGNFWSGLEGEGKEHSCELRRPARDMCGMVVQFKLLLALAVSGKLGNTEDRIWIWART